nr:cytochrome P450 734A1-like [Ipomoea batatas]
MLVRGLVWLRIKWRSRRKIADDSGERYANIARDDQAVANDYRQWKGVTENVGPNGSDMSKGGKGENRKCGSGSQSLAESRDYYMVVREAAYETFLADKRNRIFWRLDKEVWKNLLMKPIEERRSGRECQGNVEGFIESDDQSGSKEAKEENYCYKIMKNVRKRRYAWGKLSVPEGTELLITIVAIHHDPRRCGAATPRLHPAQIRRGMDKAAIHPMAFLPSAGARAASARICHPASKLASPIILAALLLHLSLLSAPHCFHAVAPHMGPNHFQNLIIGRNHGLGKRGAGCIYVCNVTIRDKHTCMFAIQGTFNGTDELAAIS